MSTHKMIDRICVIAVVLSMLIAALLMNGQALGIQEASKVMGYESRLFDTTLVHTIEIEMEDWGAFLSTCESEEYSQCNVTIDDESYNNVGIRGKGNTSLSSVSTMDSDRYSFKLEFDQYDSTLTYHGLDKLSLNNLIQDNTYLKDYLTYQMMDEFGVASPLCSFVYITVNGEDWGLYLAVEGVEDSFLQRNYGNDYGELYKPDSMSFGGGRGNGMNFDMSDFTGGFNTEADPEGTQTEASTASDDLETPASGQPQMPENFDPSTMAGESGGMTTPEEFDPSAMTEAFGEMQMPEGIAPASGSSETSENVPQDARDTAAGEDAETESTMPDFDISEIRDKMSEMMNGMGGMGSSDVKLQYIDDDPESYSNIFDNAKTDITEADQTRLIEALEKLSKGEELENTLDVDSVIRYFVVHNYVCNGDSYTGSMIHNYYLYEEDGKLSMIPWDYNLAFGTFQGSDATGTVNSPIDSPVSGSDDDRPMVDWIFDSEEYTELYHQYFLEFVETVDMQAIIDEAYRLIAPYVEKDPTKFCTYEEFETGVETLRSFCALRTESVQGQLHGEIPSTTDGQNQDASALIDASVISLSDMGTMGSTMGGGGGMPNTGGRGAAQSDESATEIASGQAEEPEAGTETSGEETETGDTAQFDGMQMPEGAKIPENMDIPENVDFSSMTASDSSQEYSDVNADFNWILLCGSAAVLLLGLMIVGIYKRKS